MGLDATISLTDVHIRAVTADDDLEAITDLLHRAYKPLADAGLRFVATYQDANTTRERFDDGYGFVAVANDVIVGTITIYATRKRNHCSLYTTEGVWHFGQFAVDPSQQQIGLGTLLLNFAEHFARLNGASELALDTAETANELIEFYLARSYRPVGHVQWDVTNYRSILLCKELGAP